MHGRMGCFSLFGGLVIIPMESVRFNSLKFFISVNRQASLSHGQYHAYSRTYMYASEDIHAHTYTKIRVCVSICAPTCMHAFMHVKTLHIKSMHEHTLDIMAHTCVHVPMHARTCPFLYLCTCHVYVFGETLLLVTYIQYRPQS